MKVLSLFDGISCGRLALERAGIPVEKYYASEIDKYAIQVAQKNYPDTIQVGDVNKLNYLELLDVDIVMGGSPCFPAGTLVFTDDGFLPIENIRVGMKVLTHTGAFKPVLRIGSKTTYELQQLSGGGCANLSCTPNHPFYVREMKRRGHFSKRTFGEPYWLAAENIQKQMVSSIVPRLTGEPYKDKTFWYFIGRYVGDGWYQKTKRKWRKDSYSYKVIICDSHDKFDELNALFKEMGCRYGYTKERTVYKFRICQKWLVDFVEQYVGNGAPNKRVPSILFQQPAEHKVAFLRGLLDSDGCVRNGAYKITSTSKELVYGVKFLVMELFGVLPQVHYTHRPEQTVIEGRVVNQHHTWEIKWYDGHKKQEKYAYKDGIFWSYLRRNHHWNKCVRVYNLEVADDNSYTADTMIVHNCQDLSIAKQNRQGLRGERSGLFWKYVEALEVIHPKWFLLENVASMRNEDRDAITATLKKIYPETECIMINSALVSAQQRKRYYWTNWHVEQPQDKGILLKDILESGQVIRDGKSHAVISSAGRTTEREYFKKNQGELVAVNIDNYFRKYGTKGKIMSADTEKTQCLTASMGCGGGNNPLIAEPVPCAMRTREDELGKFKRLETKDGGKANSLTSVQTDSMVAQPVKSTNKFQEIQSINPDKSDCLIAGYYKAPFNQSTTGVMVSAPERIGELNGLSKAQGNRIYSVRGKSVCLNANGGGGGAKTGLYKVDLPDGDYIIRKLTPVECERLQTLPDNWTEKGAIQWNYANLMDAFSPSQAGKLNSVINTIFDSYETELQNLAENWLIKQKNVSKTGVKTNSKLLWGCASNIIKNGNDNNQLTLPKDVRFAMNPLGKDVVECVLSTISNGKSMATLCTMRLENMNHTAIKGQNIIDLQTVDGCIKQLLSKCSGENSNQTRLFIILTLINLITVKAIFLCAKVMGNICVSIDNSNISLGNSLEMELSGLRMENITEISNSSRYKCLGNGWTVDVIAHIFKQLPTE